MIIINNSSILFSGKYNTERSLMRRVDNYKKDGELTGYNRIPKAYKVNKEHVEFLLQEIKKNKTIAIDDLLHLLKK